MINKWNKSTSGQQEKKSGTKPCGCGSKRTLPSKSVANNGKKNTGSATAPLKE